MFILVTKRRFKRSLPWSFRLRVGMGIPMSRLIAEDFMTESRVELLLLLKHNLQQLI